MRFSLSLALAALLAACGTPGPSASLPPDAIVGAGDPTRAAILATAFNFNAPDSIAGNPSVAARMVAQAEYLAIELPSGPRWGRFSPLLQRELLAARSEWRGALGIAPDAAPQEVVDELFAASRALNANNPMAAQAALTGPVFANPPATLASLDRLPPLPRTRIATAFANQELTRTDQEGQSSNGDGGGKGG